MATESLLAGLATESRQNPLDQYRIADEDSSGTTQYFGFLASSGAWVILRVVKGTTNSYRYANGSDAYSSAWSERASKTYDYLNKLTDL